VVVQMYRGAIQLMPLYPNCERGTQGLQTRTSGQGVLWVEMVVAVVCLMGRFPRSRDADQPNLAQKPVGQAESLALAAVHFYSLHLLILLEEYSLLECHRLGFR